MKLLYGGDCEVKAITGKVLKVLSSGVDIKTKDVLKAISDVKEVEELSVIDALRIVRESWRKTYQQDFMILKTYCSKCKTYNELKLDLTDFDIEIPDIHKDEIDFYGKSIKITPMSVGIYDKSDLNDWDLLESICSVSIDDFLLPQIQELGKLVNKETETINKLMTAEGKCQNKECEETITATMEIGESFFLA